MISAVIMAAYALMIAVTSTIASGATFSSLLDISPTAAIVIAGGVVVLYCVTGGMWSLTLTDIIQFTIMTVGIFGLLLPFAISEAGGAYAADGYARVTGKPGVVLVTSGPGVINTATAAATAYADSVPMLIISPSMPTGVEGRDTGFLHESKDQGAAMGGLITSRTARTAEQALAAIDEAFTQRRPRPIHLQIPVDLL